MLAGSHRNAWPDETGTGGRTNRNTHLEDSFLSLSLEYHENTGSTGDMTYSYYFEVPEDTSDELLSAMNWAIGDTIELPVHVVEADDADY